MDTWATIGKSAPRTSGAVPWSASSMPRARRRARPARAWSCWRTARSPAPSAAARWSGRRSRAPRDALAKGGRRTRWTRRARGPGPHGARPRPRPVLRRLRAHPPGSVHARTLRRSAGRWPTLKSAGHFVTEGCIGERRKWRAPFWTRDLPEGGGRQARSRLTDGCWSTSGPKNRFWRSSAPATSDAP